METDNLHYQRTGSCNILLRTHPSKGRSMHQLSTRLGQQSSEELPSQESKLLHPPPSKVKVAPPAYQLVLPGWPLSSHPRSFILYAFIVTLLCIAKEPTFQGASKLPPALLCLTSFCLPPPFRGSCLLCPNFACRPSFRLLHHRPSFPKAPFQILLCSLLSRHRPCQTDTSTAFPVCFRSKPPFDLSIMEAMESISSGANSIFCATRKSVPFAMSSRLLSL